MSNIKYHSKQKQIIFIRVPFFFHGKHFFHYFASILFAVVLCACSSSQENNIISDSPDISDFSDIDFTQSSYKHINNGGITTSDTMPYNIDAITGATVTVEGPAVTSSVPLSMREIENQNEGLFRGIYTDSKGPLVYEGLNLYYLLTGMTRGDSGINLTEQAYRVLLKDSNRVIVASLTVAEIEEAHERGRPYLLSYGLGNLNEQLIAPFVFDAANPNEYSEGYVAELDNAGGCLKLVYDMEGTGIFPNVAYVYISEETEPGFKHTTAADDVYASSRYTDYLITFRGEALGREMVFTVRQLEDLVRHDENGNLIEGGIGFSDSYSLANNAYWYVNEYEGLDLYKLLLYLGMNDAATMGLAESRTTLVSFIADDGHAALESFSVDTLSYPDIFGFYNKNAIDLGDGSYIPTSADLVQVGYPVLLAYGVNRYPYTITKSDEGYLSGLSNSGGPMRVVFGKTQYNHANGSNQVQLIRDVIVGNDILYNTHKYSDVPAHRQLAEESIVVTVNGEDGNVMLERVITVGEVEDLLYGADVAEHVKKAAAHVKDHYQRSGSAGSASGIYEGVNLEYFLMEVIGLPGTNGTVTFIGDEVNSETTINLGSLLRTGYHTELGRDGISPIIAFAKNGAPLVRNHGDPGYVQEIEMNPLQEWEPSYYMVENNGGPLAVLIPSSDPNHDDGIVVLNLASITIDLVPDAYAHLNSPYDGYEESQIRFFGDGLEREAEFTVSELEGRQTRAKTLDYSMLDDDGVLTELRYRGLPVFELLVEIGIKSNAGEVIIYDDEGESYTYPLSALRRSNFTNHSSPEKEALMAMLVYGTGIIGENPMNGLPLVRNQEEEGYNDSYGNHGGPLKLVVPGDTIEAASFVRNIAAIEVTANEIDSWGHGISDIYNEFLDFEFTFSIVNDDSEWSHVFTVSQLEEMTDLIIRENYLVLDIGECEGIDIWKFIMRYAGNIPGIENPVSITAYASDGYKNDLLSVFYKEGFELGVADGEGNRKPLIIAYAMNGLPLVDDEAHEGYTGTARNAAGPLRVIAETNQGASVKYMNKLVVTVPGQGSLDGYISEIP